MADGRKYYVMCEDKCLFEAMTKEQTLAAIEQAVTTGEIENVDTGFVTKIKEQNAAAPLSFWVGTQAEYNALADKAANCFYIITDDTTFPDLEKAFEDLSKEFSDTADAMGEQINGFRNSIGALLYTNTAGNSIAGVTVPELKNYHLICVIVELPSKYYNQIVNVLMFREGNYDNIFFSGNAGCSAQTTEQDYAIVGVDASISSDKNGKISSVYADMYSDRETEGKSVTILKILGVC